MPATPTSVIRLAQSPSAASVTAASSATGRSLVPAVTIATVPLPLGGVGRDACHENAVATIGDPRRDVAYLLGALAGAVDDLGKALPNRAVVIDCRETERVELLQ